MGETIEKRLKDYKGYQVYKIIDNKGTTKENACIFCQIIQGKNRIVGKLHILNTGKNGSAESNWDSAD